MISDKDQIIMETLYWLGIPTLFRCKNDPDPKNCDIALVGHQIVLVTKLPKEINI
ncbi:MAG TPA: hypothetical protein QF874_01315 [Pelagibacteraceae bacterium]|jgi:hypothetical protein|nr:hypothetical protein [Pelagibacteraceae bacterium]|tara:strand:- start:565 stop:729 length:165 start_codon:yes stop_codon:yes gene_type:complete